VLASVRRGGVYIFITVGPSDGSWENNNSTRCQQAYLAILLYLFREIRELEAPPTTLVPFSHSEFGRSYNRPVPLFCHVAALSNTCHLALAPLRCSLWVEWVPSDANGADIPSRPHGPDSDEFYASLGCVRWPGGMRFPSLPQIRAPRLGDVRTQ